ncbi:F-box domain-containing protein [Mycena sanguinolenta]|uniref:F-box domain-containing protein n=1 Tax=Mycena sanguinolenta TaxID=230812 RepID=A0A8H6ZH53_9AGAR|nr:F-box domain-containing protein [Mycena sanguinolenta]
MSVDSLRARIATLDSEIELQKRLLRRLENDKSLAQQQLNAALDPMARLPLEISSEIFFQSLSMRPSGEQDVPTVLLRICHAWTDIALAAPRLWTTVGIHFPCGDHFAEVLPIWFQQAGNFPLSVSISLRGHSINWNHRVSDILWRHGGQLRHLEILDDDDIAPTDKAIDLFGDITSVSLPLLETLTIRCRHEQRIYHTSQIFDLLHAAPNIADVIFDNMRVVEDSGAQMLVVPTLRRLTFGGPTTYTDDFILHFLALPSLETLSLPLSYISIQELAVFVQ